MYTNSHKAAVYQETRLAAASKRRPSTEEPEDIQLAKANAQRRLEKKHPSLGQSTADFTARTDPSRSRDIQTDNAPRSKGLARGMRTRSTSDLAEVPQFEKHAVAEVSSHDFYGNSTPRVTGGNHVHETRSSTRVQERERRPREIRPRSPTPPPTWTKDKRNKDWTKDWHGSIIYPVEGKDRARVDMGDVEKLDEGEYLNDNLIDFYLRYLQHQLERDHPEWAKRIYFQNTFFYSKLTKLERGMKGINYEAVKRWTSKVDLLAYDYIIIPINEHSHWYVAIICNTPKLLQDANAVDNSQNQENDGLLGGEVIEVGDMPQSSSAPLGALKHTLKDSGGGDVDTVMRDMSLEDKESRVTQEPPSDPLEGNGEQVAANASSPPLASVTSDLVESKTPMGSQTKKPKRKSLPPVRKYDPKEFRIITLDSLGSSHTQTCSNLKTYLAKEIKEKRGEDIEPPRSVGTTAKNIPKQNNYYDCGLFLLSYVEMFLAEPDVFVHDILQNEVSVVRDWPAASTMRNAIRNLLFDLQKEQLADAKRPGKEKIKVKKVTKAEDKVPSTSTSKSSSREVSKSARVSPEGQTSGEAAEGKTNAVESQAEPPMKPLVRQTSGSAEPTKAELGRPSISSRSVSPSKPAVPKPVPQREAHNIDAATSESTKGPSSRIGELLSGASKYISGLLHDKPAASRRKPSDPDVIEIQDSPQKGETEKVRPRSRVSEMQNGGVNPKRIEKVEEPKARRRQDAETSQQKVTKDDSRSLISPTPDDMGPSLHVSTNLSVTDLRSPSPEGDSLQHKHYTKGFHDKRKGFGNVEVADSAGEDEEDDPVDLIQTSSRPNGLSMTITESSAHDEEMLMLSSNHQEVADEDADASLLTVTEEPSSPVEETSLQRRGGGASQPPTPKPRHLHPRKSAATSPPRGTKRKNPGSGEGDNWQDLGRRPSPIHLDPMEEAMIGNRSKPAPKPATRTHIRFPLDDLEQKNQP